MIPTTIEETPALRDWCLVPEQNVAVTLKEQKPKHVRNFIQQRDPLQFCG
jgi:hypothetical protein